MISVMRNDYSCQIIPEFFGFLLKHRIPRMIMLKQNVWGNIMSGK